MKYRSNKTWWWYHNNNLNVAKYWHDFRYFTTNCERIKKYILFKVSLIDTWQLGQAPTERISKEEDSNETVLKERRNGTFLWKALRWIGLAHQNRSLIRRSAYQMQLHADQSFWESVNVQYQKPNEHVL